jgi:hypothetical protein
MQNRAVKRYYTLSFEMIIRQMYGYRTYFCLFPAETCFGSGSEAETQSVSQAEFT